MTETIQLSVASLTGDRVDIEARPKEKVADLTNRLKSMFGMDERAQAGLLCGAQAIPRTITVDQLPGHDLHIVLIVGSSLCEITVHGDFPADPTEFFPDDNFAKWPRADHCYATKRGSLRAILDQKTKISVSAIHRDLSDHGLKPDPTSAISNLMEHARRIEQERLSRGSGFDLMTLLTGFQSNRSNSGSMLIRLGLVSERDAVPGGYLTPQLSSGSSQDSTDFDRVTKDLWVNRARIDMAMFHYAFALDLLNSMHEQSHTRLELDVKRDLSAEAKALAEAREQRRASPRDSYAGESDDSCPQCFGPGPYTFHDFKKMFGKHAWDQWDAAGAAGIGEEEKLAEDASRLALEKLESYLKSPTWEAYALRFDLEVLNDSDGFDVSDELDLLLRYMAWGMTSCPGTFTIAHSCDIVRSDSRNIQVILRGIAHPMNTTKRKGLGRSKSWWHSYADSHEKIGSGWQMVWRFAQGLRQLGGASTRSLECSSQLRWRTVLKQIRSRTLRRCGVPACTSDDSSQYDTSAVDDMTKFFFFEGSEGFVQAKKQLISSIRCRRVGFSRLQAHEASDAVRTPEPYACDIHFAGKLGVPLAWMWGLNTDKSERSSSISCHTSSNETSARELRKQIEEETCPSVQEDLWGDTAIPPPLVKSAYPKRSVMFKQMLNGAHDTDEDGSVESSASD